MGFVVLFSFCLVLRHGRGSPSKTLILGLCVLSFHFKCACEGQTSQRRCGQIFILAVLKQLSDPQTIVQQFADSVLQQNET